MLDGVRFRGWGHGGDTPCLLRIHVYSSYDRTRYAIWFRKNYITKGRASAHLLPLYTPLEMILLDSPPLSGSYSSCQAKEVIDTVRSIY